MKELLALYLAVVAMVYVVNLFIPDPPERNYEQAVNYTEVLQK